MSCFSSAGVLVPRKGWMDVGDEAKRMAVIKVTTRLSSQGPVSPVEVTVGEDPLERIRF